MLRLINITRSSLFRYSLGLIITAAILLFIYPDLSQNLFATGAGMNMFMAHGYCYFWVPSLVVLHVMSDSVIGASYVAISLTLAFLIYRARRDIPFHWVFLAFGLFIVACGATHFMEVITVWNATYWLSGYVKLITAVASFATAVVLPAIIPKTLGLAREAKTSAARKQELEILNQELMNEIIRREQTEQALSESEYKLRTLVDSMNEGLLQVDENDNILFVNDCFCAMTGFQTEELIGTNWSRLLYDEAPQEFVSRINERRQAGISDRYETCLRKKSDEILWVIVGGVPILNNEKKVSGSIGVFTDITERKRAEEQLLHDAFHDGLTGLVNRVFFTDHLQITIDSARRDDSRMFAVLFLDFDRFKIINDSLGHSEGDNLLKQIAGRLKNSIRQGDLVARLGGDEFTVLVNKMNDPSVALQVVERIQKDLEAPFLISDNEIFISASIGISLSTQKYEKAEDMLRDADLAMYRAKAAGSARHQVFDQFMHEQALKSLYVENELRRAIEQKELTLNYQPILHLETGRVVGFESLVRWTHPEFGVMAPMEFIPIAEENNLIVPLGNWILDESCRQFREWQNSYALASDMKISVNLSFKQFQQPDLAQQVGKTLMETGLNAQYLNLEITESHLMEDSERVTGILKHLRNLGIELSLDDFGTGYSSLSHLHRLPVNYLKIDRSFVAGMADYQENPEIVHTIIKLAQNLKLKVIAEGIETAGQLEQLKMMNCEFGQGYYFSRPMDSAATEKFIEEYVRN